MDLELLLYIGFILICIISSFLKKNKTAQNKKPRQVGKMQTTLFDQKKQTSSVAPAVKKGKPENIPEGVSEEGNDPCHAENFIPMEGEDPCHPEESIGQQPPEEEAYSEEHSDLPEDEAGGDILRGIIWSEILNRKY